MSDTNMNLTQVETQQKIHELQDKLRTRGLTLSQKIRLNQQLFALKRLFDEEPSASAGEPLFSVEVPVVVTPSEASQKYEKEQRERLEKERVECVARFRNELKTARSLETLNALFPDVKKAILSREPDFAVERVTLNPELVKGFSDREKIIFAAQGEFYFGGRVEGDTVVLYTD